MAATRTSPAGVWWASPARSRRSPRRICRARMPLPVRLFWACRRRPQHARGEPWQQRRLTTQDFNPHDELRYFQRQDLRPNIKRQPVTWRPNADARATPIPVQNYGNQAGGGTVHYGAVSWRMHEDDFRARSNTIARYGEKVIPSDSSLADWPLSYTELEPFYDKAEYELGVSGKAGNLLGQKIDGGNVFEAPRRREYPLPPLRLDQGAILFEAATRKLGYHPFSTPRAILSEPYHDRPACTYCGFCQAFGCHV